MPASVLVLIGPEGDFTPQEVEQAVSAGFQPVTLGNNVLRGETAAIAAPTLAVDARHTNPFSGPKNRSYSRRYVDNKSSYPYLSVTLPVNMYNGMSRSMNDYKIFAEVSQLHQEGEA